MATVDAVVPGKRYLVAGSFVLLGAGIAELIAGAIVISDSSGYYIGGVYVGIIAIISASRGFVLDERSNLISFGILQVCTVIVAIVGTAIQASNYNFVSSLEACSSYSDSLSTTCSPFPDTYSCTGNSDYYLYAYACEKTYTRDNGITDNQCSCVTNSNDGTCYSYTHINDCHKLVSVLPAALQTSYAFDLICLFSALFLLILTLISYYRPGLVLSPSERTAGAGDLSQPVVAPTVVSAPTTSPIVTTGQLKSNNAATPAQPARGTANYV